MTNMTTHCHKYPQEGSSYFTIPTNFLIITAYPVISAIDLSRRYVRVTPIHLYLQNLAKSYGFLGEGGVALFSTCLCVCTCLTVNFTRQYVPREGM